MGMFDYVVCEAPLPDGAQMGAMQSKDLDCYMDDLRISADGRLLIKRGSEWEDLNYHGDFNFYGDERVGEPQSMLRGGRWYYERERVWHEYCARFTEGQLTKLWAVHDGPVPKGCAQTPPSNPNEDGL